MSLLNVVILAAGKGTRMYSTKPKVLHELAGKPLVQHVLDTALLLSPQKMCVVYGHGGDAVPAALKDYPAEFALQEPQLGTGHAVQQAMPLLPDASGEGFSHTLILYGDVPLTRVETLQKMQAAGPGLVMLTVNLDNPTGYGRIVRSTTGSVCSIVEEKDASPEQRQIQEVNTGIMLVPTHELRGWLSQLGNNNAQGEYYLTDIVAMAVQSGMTVTTVQPDFEWETHGINNKTQLATLERIKQQTQAEVLLQRGVTLMDPARLDIRGKLECGSDVSIDVGCVFEGHVSLGDHVTIGPYCVIKNARIAAGSKIAAYSHIEEAELEQGCLIGPFARLRPGTQLQQGVHIGNFVEVKNSQIAAGSKANHLSYLGDSSIGSKVNIGAGTITCNYDGANKFRTIIEDDVFVGSDTQLVAPITVGKGATIGAGSTITRDVPAGELTLSRSKQTTVTGWKRPVKKKAE